MTLKHMKNIKNGDAFFEAILSLGRSEITGRSLARLLIVYPLITIKLVIGIYWQALRLWLKRCPVHDHPNKSKVITAK